MTPDAPRSRPRPSARPAPAARARAEVRRERPLRARGRGSDGEIVHRLEDTAVADLSVRIGRNRDAPYGWSPVWILVLVSLIDRIETAAVAGTLPLLQEEWGFSDTVGGAIPTAASIAGVIAVLPAGYLADRKDRRLILAVVVAAWSIITLGSALAITFTMFFASRVILGAADNIDSPAASSLIADYYPPQTRAKAYGLHRMAFFAGGSIGVLIAGVLGELFGWRAAFLAAILPGLLVAWLCYRLIEPPRGGIDRLVASDGDAAADGSGEALASALQDGWAGLSAQIKHVLRIRTLALIFVGLVALFIGLSGIFFWLPSFFERTRDVGEGLAGTLTAIIGIVGIIGGAILGGQLGDRVHGVHRGARVLVGGSGLLGGAILFAAAFAGIPSLALQVVVLTMSVLLMSTAIPNLTAAIADVLPASQRGVGFAFLQFFLSLGSSFGPLAVGAASDALGSLTLAFYVLLVPMLIGCVFVLRARFTYEDDAREVLEEARRRARGG